MSVPIGFLHPGKMGIVLAISAKNSGNQVYWASGGRSAASRRRAEDAGLNDAGSLAELCRKCDVVVSICPPEFADEMADRVMAAGFRGTFLDANAISVERARKMARRMQARGVDFIDGGIIGMPSLSPGVTWLHLSGPSASRVADCFAAGPLATDVMGDEAGRASALKMCFSAYSKGSTALACAVITAAENLGVLPDLQRQWDRKGPGAAKLEADIRVAAPKAWRFVAEMHELAATLESAGLPPGFHKAAAEIYQRLRHLKDQEDAGFDRILAHLTRQVPVR
jgi:3-hydroxyisobutyrate dehydrogenase-like beta-hydroxyacid dehydrogenase